MTTVRPRSPKRPMRASSRQQGFSLIEIAVSLLLVAISLLGMAALLTTTHKNSASSFLRTQASILVTDIVEKIRSNRAHVLANLADYEKPVTDCTKPPSSSATVDLDLHQFHCLVRSSLPAGAAVIRFDPASNILTLTVSWDDSRGTEGSPVQTFEFQTQL